MNRRSAPAGARRTKLVGPKLLAALAALLMLLTACTSPDNGSGVVIRKSEDPEGYKGASIPQPYQLPDATFTDSSGGEFNLRTTPSKPVVLMFFGYTNCPDVCIAAMSDLATALNRMEPQVRDQVQVVFVTTDPARDTPEVMRAYLDRFDPSFQGVTSELPEIKSVAEQVGVDFDKMETLPSGGYEVAHSAQVIGFDSQRNGVVVWTQGTAIGDLMHDFNLLVEKQ